MGADVAFRSGQDPPGAPQNNLGSHIRDPDPSPPLSDFLFGLRHLLLDSAAGRGQHLPLAARGAGPCLRQSIENKIVRFSMTALWVIAKMLNHHILHLPGK